MTEIVKLGLDLHGVIDAIPEFLSVVSNLLVHNGHEVHIITGQEDGKPLRNELEEKGIKYTHLFSVSTHLIKEGLEVRWDEKGTPWFDEKIWREAKGKYCQENGITLHLDDSGTYHKHFVTPYLRVGRMV